MIVPFAVFASAEAEVERVADPLSEAMDRCADGDEGAFGRVYDLLKPRLFAFLGRRMRDRADIDDIVQLTLERIYVHRERFLRGSDVVPWALTIARRLMVDAQRKSKNDPLMASAAIEPELLEVKSDACPHERALLTEAAAVLRAELAAIPESHRAAFEMIRVDGLSVAQTAEVLGITQSAAKVRAHRVYQRLCDALSSLGWELRER